MKKKPLVERKVWRGLQNAAHIWQGHAGRYCRQMHAHSRKKVDENCGTSFLRFIFVLRCAEWQPLLRP